MTIALGILAGETGSIVMAADTEITAGEAKTEGGKIYWAMDNPTDMDTGLLAVTGAGPVGYIEASYSELKEVFLTHPEAPASDMADRLKKCFKAFYKEKVIPFTYDRPHIELVVSVR